MINFLKVGQYDNMIFKMTLNILHVAIKKVTNEHVNKHFT